VRPFAVAAEPFAIRVRQNRRRYFVTLDGELDLVVAPALMFELRRVEARHPELLVVDLRGLTFMDLTGLRVLVSAAEHARQRGYELAVVRGSRGVRRLLELVRIEAVLSLIDDPAEVNLTRPAVASATGADA
jgi:anti-anti-sigma factor